jgi:hypothetical protein
MLLLLSCLLRREPESLWALLVNSAAVLAVIAVVILWNRGWGRQWQQTRVRNWPTVSGKFDEGEVITMRKGRSGEISGYKVYLGYEYDQGDELDGGLYTLPVSGEFETPEDAERYRKVMSDQHILVRVSPRNPKRSGVLDEDIKHLLHIKVRH